MIKKITRSFSVLALSLFVLTGCGENKTSAVTEGNVPVSYTHLTLPTKRIV